MAKSTWIKQIIVNGKSSDNHTYIIDVYKNTNHLQKPWLPDEDVGLGSELCPGELSDVIVHRLHING